MALRRIQFELRSIAPRETRSTLRPTMPANCAHCLLVANVETTFHAGSNQGPVPAHALALAFRKPSPKYVAQVGFQHHRTGAPDQHGARLATEQHPYFAPMDAFRDPLSTVCITAAMCDFNKRGAGHLCGLIDALPCR